MPLVEPIYRPAMVVIGVEIFLAAEDTFIPHARAQIQKVVRSSAVLSKHSHGSSELDHGGNGQVTSAATCQRGAKRGGEGEREGGGAEKLWEGVVNLIRSVLVRQSRWSQGAQGDAVFVSLARGRR